MSWVAVGAAAAVASATLAGYSAYSQSKTAEKQAEADASAQASRGRLEAERILKQKTKQQSMARAAAAANGLDVNEGTALKINDEIEKAGQYDAEIARQTGYNASQRLMAQADQYGKNANTALASGALNMVSAGVSAKKGWK
ncbi:hypothetical protein IH414_17775 [Acinetobacter baumannii]|uniref:hypothetical protein n=1 Tax=Acinetobacter baumannii TaxID=470 RepID=UPI001866DB0A|nr:hypothetical protein [Acinetobacter baumannii]EKW5801044.1 hypothetical protein [Acinetobacter baumannii]ELA6692083.1 hypothetical protein [Acinetobacter baumannii]ELA6696292.1 hypothetical protein [Acinetobacter baumannii]ELO7552122.1 hypothetical protein [Acinetobacter baumannii]MCD7371273.1 hypothetical protein [Acinetobacter baumannii]